MSKVIAIALNTFKEAVRNRILYVLLFFAGLILLGSWVASTLSISNQEKVMRDLGVAAISVLGLLIAIFVGIGLIYNELDKKTIYTIIAKPISRWQFILGKYLGLLLTIYVNVLVMTWFFCAVLHFRTFVSADAIYAAIGKELPTGGYAPIPAFELLGYYLKAIAVSVGRSTLTVATFGAYSHTVTSGLMQGTLLTCIELGVVTAFAILYSSFSSSILSAFLTLLTFIIGRTNSDLYTFADTIVQRSGGVDGLAGGQKLGYYLLNAVSHIAPNLEVFNIRPEISNFVQTDFDPYAIVYGFGYSAGVLILAIIIFNRRNFK